jgi:hypothetical protein
MDEGVGHGGVMTISMGVLSAGVRMCVCPFLTKFVTSLFIYSGGQQSWQRHRKATEGLS